MDIEVIIAVAFIILLLVFSLNFNKKYAPFMHTAGMHPFARFLAGLAVVITATLNPALAIVAFMAVFFWIGDIHILNVQ